MSKVAAFFDLDKTIIATSTSAAFTRPMFDGGLVTRGDVVRTALSHALYLKGGADAENTERLRKQLSELATGWEVSKVKQIVADALETHIDPYVYQEAINLIAEHHELGHDVVIISASVTELVEPIAEMLGADHFVASVLSVEDGKYTGEIEFYAYGEFKAEMVEELAAKYDYDLARSYAYSDSITDQPMLDTVGYGTVINPDKGLRRMAAEHGWNQLIFANPVTLKSTMANRVAKIPERVAHTREQIAGIPDKVAALPELVNDRLHERRERTNLARAERIEQRNERNEQRGEIKESRPITDMIPIVIRENPKKSAAIAAGLAAAGVTLAAASRKSGVEPLELVEVAEALD